MANVIIGIHGLGNKPSEKTLGKWWELAMMEGLKTHGFQTKLPKFEMVYWADILHEQPLNETITDANDPLYIDEVYVPAPDNFVIEEHSTRKKIMDFIGQQMNRIFLTPDYTLNYSFISDAIVSNYFKDLEIYYSEDLTAENDKKYQAKDLIKKRLTDTLEKYKWDNILLISHSMGSIIAYDVLTFEAPEIPIHTFVTMGSPLGLPVVISKIASEQKQHHIENPQMATPESVTNNWFNFSDILDKVAFNYMLSDDFTSNQAGVKPMDFQVINNYEIKEERNPHKSYGYLRTKEFSEILNDFIQTARQSPQELIIAKLKTFIRDFKKQIGLN